MRLKIVVVKVVYEDLCNCRHIFSQSGEAFQLEKIC